VNNEGTVQECDANAGDKCDEAGNKKPHTTN
jgi:hypothetical protein